MLEGSVDRDNAAVAGQLLNTVIRAIGMEMRVREVEDLERQVEEEREARRRADTILAQLSQANTELSRTIRTIETPASEPTAAFSQEPSGATEQPGRVEPQPAVEGAQEGTERSEPREAPQTGAESFATT